jgi:1,4-dihydroxy-2-naphthoate octaprenyltransferase
MGKKWAKNYHLFLLLVAFIAALVGAFSAQFSAFQYLFLLAFIPLVRHVSLIIKINDPSQYDSQLKVVALSTFFLSTMLLTSKLFF